MTFKTVLRALTPPAIMALYRYFRKQDTPIFMWGGIYSNYRDVSVTGDGYRGDVWIKSRSAQTENLAKASDRLCTIPPFVESRYSLLGFLAAINLEKQGVLKILDFGGAMGIAYVHLLSTVVNSQDVRYYILDNERSCEEGSRIFADDERVQFVSSLTEIPRDIDIVFMSGVLQYIEDYATALKSVLTKKPRYCLITLLSAGDIPTFACEQTNLEGSILPHWFFNIDEIIMLMKVNQYQLIFKGSAEPVVNMDNYPLTTNCPIWQISFLGYVIIDMPIE